MSNRTFNRFLAAGLSAAALMAVGCSDSGSGPKALDCHSDPVTPLPENFSATGYWTLNDDLQGVFPAGEDGAVDSIALAQHYCEYGADEGRPFGEDPVYASSEEGSSESNGGNSNVGSSGEGTTSSSSEEEVACERTLMPNHYFKFEGGYVGYSGKPMVLGWQPSADDFAAGEWFLPEGYDCALAVQVDGAPDSYNLNVVEAWAGENIDSVRVEKVTFPGGSKPVQGSSSSSRPVSSASQQQQEACSGYTAWDGVTSWLEYESNGPDKLYSFNGGLYKCTGAKHYSYCAWSPDIEYSDWVFIRNCDGSTPPSSSRPSSSSSKPSSSSSRPSSSSSRPSSSSQGGNAGHCILNWFKKTDFDRAFPESGRHQNYTWNAFQEALAKVPNFICSTAGNDVTKQKQELAAVFAHWMQEVGALRYIEEICGTQGTCLNHYNSGSSSYPAQTGKSYHGRGPTQISWPYNYGPFSEFYFHDKMVLLNAPERVMNEGTLAFASAFWFWSDRGCGSSFWSTGFGATTNIINGGLECGGNYGTKAQNRERYYGQFLSQFGVSDNRSKSAGCGGW